MDLLDGVPCHAWNSDFFVCMQNSLDSFVCLGENTTNKACMDIARIIIRVPASFTLKDEYYVDIDGKDFRLVIREDSYGTVSIERTKKENFNKSSIHTSLKDSWSNFGEEDTDGEGENLVKEDSVLSNGKSTNVPYFERRSYIPIPLPFERRLQIRPYFLWCPVRRVRSN